MYAGPMLDADRKGRSSALFGAESIQQLTEIEIYGWWILQIITLDAFHALDVCFYCERISDEHIMKCSRSGKPIYKYKVTCVIEF